MDDRNEIMKIEYKSRPRQKSSYRGIEENSEKYGEIICDPPVNAVS
jgi:23S rRNA A1618 N6-methylase RlmF